MDLMPDTKKLKKKISATEGKNIRISTNAWNEIREYCFKNGLYLGGFVERVVLEKIRKSKSK